MTQVHTVTVHHGDCLDVLPTLAAESISAVVTDPPYGLGFMGATWDTFVASDVPMHRRAEIASVNIGCSRQGGRQRACDDYQKRQARDMRAYQSWCEAWAHELLRVCKPGAHLLAFGGSRTYHRLACAIEDAGWEVRDCLMWVYGTGFPKSLDVSKAIDKAAGAERERVAPQRRTSASVAIYASGFGVDGFCPQVNVPATPEAAQWAGWGTALKPSYEPILLARKPLAGTVAASVLAHGTGAINVDACRVEAEPREFPPTVKRRSGIMNTTGEMRESWSESRGRWPANLIHDGSPEVTALFPETGGERPERVGVKGGNGGALGSFAGSTAGAIGVWPADSGGSAARFFYVPKADRSDRGEGNRHPTVKPQDLLRYLVTLVTPPGGVVLDPFAGSGTTGVVCCRESRPCVLIEREAEWCDTILRRLRAVGQVAIPGLETNEVLR